MHGTGQKLNAEVALKISFYGVVCSHGGIQPDPNKISALEQMSAPTSRETLQIWQTTRRTVDFIDAQLAKKPTTKSRTPSVVKLP